MNVTREEAVGKAVSRLVQGIVSEAIRREAIVQRHTNGHRKITPLLKLQGRYMGLIRTAPPRKKAQYKRIRAEKGVEAAIRAIQRDRE